MRPTIIKVSRVSRLPAAATFDEAHAAFYVVQDCTFIFVVLFFVVFVFFVIYLICSAFYCIQYVVQPLSIFGFVNIYNWSLILIPF
jgi:hypothetical protein